MKIESVQLPLMIHEKNKIKLGTVVMAWAAIIYLIPNHFPASVPHLLPFTWVDQLVPLVPWTIWIYASELILIAVSYLLAKDMENVNKYIYSFLAIQTLSCIIFVFWPTTYPRDLFPLPPDLPIESLTFQLFTSSRILDSPNNCFPSLHVSSVYLSSFIFLHEQKKKFPLFLCWATAVALSTLTTKQHYMADIVSGFTLSVFFYWLFYYKVRYKRPLKTPSD